MRISLVVAMDNHRAIGKGNDLPWRLPEDLKRFKALTLGGGEEHAKGHNYR